MAANEYIDVGPNGMVPEEAATNGGVANAGDIVALNPSGQIDLSMLPPSTQPLAGGTSTIVANQLILGICLPVSGSLASNFSGSQASCQTTATDASTFTVYHVAAGTNTQTEIGTIVFAAASYTATFSSASSVAVSPGDTIQVIAPATVDATLAGISISLSFTPSVNIMSISGGAGTLTANSILMAYCSTVNGSVANNFGGSVGSCVSAATNSATFPVFHVATGTNTQTEIGTMVFVAGAYTATFETISGVNLNFDVGDTLLVLCPSTADATLANVTCSIVGVN